MAKIKIPSSAITGNYLGSATEVLTGPLNKLWRAKILINRSTSTMPQNKGDTTPIVPVNPHLNRRLQQAKREGDLTNEKLRHISEDTPLNVLQSKTINNQIIIINPNTSPYTKIIIQGMPSELDVTPDSNWATVKSAGRNNPFMIYTGGEDTLSFEISWFSIQEDRKDVINKCRLLESWTRADGYNSSPPILWISWGSANIFKDCAFVLISASYTLSNFQNSYLKELSRKSKGNPIDLGLLPNCAVQKLIFKKVTSNNTTHEEIISRESLNNTNGVIIN